MSDSTKQFMEPGTETGSHWRCFKRRSTTLAHVPIFAANNSNGVPGCGDSILAPFWHIPEPAMEKLINNDGAVQIGSADGVSWSIERLRACSQSRRDVNVM